MGMAPAERINDFFCVKYGCDMPSSVCIKRQKLAGAGWAGGRTVIEDPGCVDCAQGRALVEQTGEIRTDTPIKMVLKPVKPVKKGLKPETSEKNFAATDKTADASNAQQTPAKKRFGPKPKWENIVCSVEGCEKPAKAKGMCKSQYAYANYLKHKKAIHEAKDSAIAAALENKTAGVTANEALKKETLPESVSGNEITLLCQAIVRAAEIIAAAIREAI